ncbi:hypothetical protein BT63DRAFT_453504 [Microthyrium microscopicum]|uniref:Uncharacterized protein n=1 Tax=Microthyrium microscopicum TaxID=703497 RepID=A0A6A6UFQ8_9PEZI|nr:hypothetical protein BT63DRAFT_453504 [Microthyrium microscopicum]
MSNSITIPSSFRKPSSPTTPSSFASSNLSPSSYTPSESRLSKEAKGKGKQDAALEERERWASSPFRRRQSLMGKELERSEHIVVDVGSPEAPQLISCVKSSQGFDWNRSIFLPRYLTGDDGGLEHRQEPIEDVVVTDEEAQKWLPQW